MTFVSTIRRKNNANEQNGRKIFFREEKSRNGDRYRASVMLEWKDGQSSGIPYLQCRQAFPRRICFLQTSQKENLKTRVLSNLECNYRMNGSMRCDQRMMAERAGEWRKKKKKRNDDQNDHLFTSYLHTLHFVPTNKIFLEQTLHVDNLIRLIHLRRKKE